MNNPKEQLNGITHANSFGICDSTPNNIKKQFFGDFYNIMNNFISEDSEYEETSKIANEKVFERIPYCQEVINTQAQIDYLNSIKNYPNESNNNIKDYLLKQILDCSWDIISGSQKFAKENKRIILDSEIATNNLLTPLFDFVDNREPGIESIINCLSVKSAIRKPTIQSLDLFQSRIVKRLLYYFPYSMEHEKIIDIIHGKLNQDDTESRQFWIFFLIDIYYRILCNFLSAGNTFKEICENCFKKYSLGNETSTLCKLKGFIDNPLQSYRDCASIHSLKNKYNQMAKACNNAIECKWLVISLKRLYPLYVSLYENMKSKSIIVEVINASKNQKFFDSEFATYTYLHCLLIDYSETLGLNHLTEFEKKFQKFHGFLNKLHIINLQIEYASCLYIALSNTKKEDLSGLIFMDNVKKGAKLENTIYFKNILTQLLTISPENDYKNIGVQKWLVKRINSFFKYLVTADINTNLFNIFNYPVSTKRMAAQSNFITHLIENFKFYEKQLIDNSIISCRVLNAYYIVNSKFRAENMFGYIEKSLGAGKYYLVYNSFQIISSIYTLYFYGNPANRERLLELTDSLVSSVGRDIPKNRLFWVYYFGLKSSLNKLELSFTKELWKILADCKLKDKTVKRTKIVENILNTLNSSGIIKKFTTQGSMLANVLSSNTRNSLVWNIMGTNLYNNKKNFDFDPLEMIAFFYELAIVFAKNEKSEYQMIKYNYIRIKSEIYKNSGTPPPESFFKEVFGYLSSVDSKKFITLGKKESSFVFFELADKYKSSLSDENRENLEKILSLKPWKQLCLSIE